MKSNVVHIETECMQNYFNMNDVIVNTEIQLKNRLRACFLYFIILCYDEFENGYNKKKEMR